MGLQQQQQQDVDHAQSYRLHRYLHNVDSLRRVAVEGPYVKKKKTWWVVEGARLTKLDIKQRNKIEVLEGVGYGASRTRLRTECKHGIRLPEWRC